MKQELKRYSELSSIPYYAYPQTSKELGYACAKPFPVASLAIVKEGGSKILQIQ
jgi:large subunit ribosomal protein L30e